MPLMKCIVKDKRSHKSNAFHLLYLSILYLFCNCISVPPAVVNHLQVYGRCTSTIIVGFEMNTYLEALTFLQIFFLAASKT